MKRARIITLILFSVAAIASLWKIQDLKFSFDFEQFFPDNDEDLAFFRDFIKEFETDDNFLMIAIERKNGVFDQSFLTEFHDFTIQSRNLPNVVNSQGLTKIDYPVLTPFGLAPLPAIHIDQPELYERDKKQILADERFVHNLISEDATALVLYLKLTDRIQLEEARSLMDNLTTLLDKYNFEGYHFLGRPYFQKELVDMQKREIIISALISSILILIIMFLIFRKPIGIGISVVSIGMGMLLFIGYMGFSGRPFSAMAALYPVLMIIVGTSDVIHIMIKYIDELKKGMEKKMAIRITLREIGMATFLTSLTTAIGFASLFTSKVPPIRDFGINAAIGVLIAYFTVLFFTTSLLSFFSPDQLIKYKENGGFWDKAMHWVYTFTLNHKKGIIASGVLTIVISILGISMISTNYSIMKNMPKGKKITEDFKFFEKKLTGFRPMEIAVFAQEPYNVNDFEVLTQMDKVEQFIKSETPLKATASITSLYKSLNQMSHNNNSAYYIFPTDEERFRRLDRWASKLPPSDVKVLVSKDNKKSRISSRLSDIGADSIKVIGERIDKFIKMETDSSIVKFQRTGTGLILDKNAAYIRSSLLSGLGMAVLIVSMIMVLLFKNIRLLVISLVPNFIPLLLAGALLGFLGIELDAGVSIVFAVVFGIAVDDTIHFLTKMRLTQRKGIGLEESIKITFMETGKAICLTTIILFFGFLVMLFSIHPPSIIVGLLISLTLFSALICDLVFIPLLSRWLLNN